MFYWDKAVSSMGCIMSCFDSLANGLFLLKSKVRFSVLSSVAEPAPSLPCDFSYACGDLFEYTFSCSTGIIDTDKLWFFYSFRPFAEETNELGSKNDMENA